MGVSTLPRPAVNIQDILDQKPLVYTGDTLNSWFRDLGPIQMPTYDGRQLRMTELEASGPVMPEGFHDYAWLVHHLLLKVNKFIGPVYMTVDERWIVPGSSHRRPGVHVDGRWDPQAGNWCGLQGGHRHDGQGRHALIVAADVGGCMAYTGNFQATPAEDGDLEHARHLFTEPSFLYGDRAYGLSPDCVHESLVMGELTRRSWLRLTFDPTGTLLE